MPVLNTLADCHDEMTSWRRELHQHPELGYEEHWTSDYIAAKLTSFGIEIHRGMGKTGVVGIIRGQGDSSRMIGLRSDIDALPMTEENNFDHVSQRPGVMHACGHDGHTAMLLGAARYLAETRNFDGTVAVIFQPAEEGGAGGKAMMEDGLFDQFQMETVWGMHNWPGLDVGKMIVQRGPSMAAADMFTSPLRAEVVMPPCPTQHSIPSLPAHLWFRRCRQLSRAGLILSILLWFRSRSFTQAPPIT